MPKNYDWEFSYNRNTYENVMRVNGHGDLSIEQLVMRPADNSIKSRAGVSFAQGAERNLFVSLLSYIDQCDVPSEIFDQDSALYNKMRRIPFKGGNFCGFSEREEEVNSSFIGFNRKFSSSIKNTQIIGNYGKGVPLSIDRNKNLHLHSLYLSGKPINSLLFPKKKVDEVIFGLLFLAGHGMVRSSKEMLERRLKKYTTGEYRHFLARIEQKIKDLQKRTSLTNIK